MNYYNEIDPKAAAWLRELIKQNLIPDGIVDTRSITEIKPNELKQYTQCHFFAGIGGWSLALQLAGWPATRPVWTGSCPCQPFSTAGKQLGNADERHLWPIFFNLIRECQPECVFGEQVANAIGKGWLDGVSADLESEGYACGATVLGAHSIGAPHIRQRLFWVANADRTGPQPGNASAETDGHGCAVVADGGDCGVGHPSHSRLERWSGTLSSAERSLGQTESCGLSGAWSDYDLIPCQHEKVRRIEPGLAPLAHGVPARVVRLRGYGNAIVPQVAAAFVQAYIDVT